MIKTKFSIILVLLFVGILSTSITVYASTLILSPTDAVGDGFSELEGATDITTVVIGTHTYTLTASYLDNGVQIIDITDPNNPIPVSTIEDGVGGFTELEGATDITTVVIGTNTYALVASTLDNGVQIIDISDPSIPTPVAAFEDSIDGNFTNLAGASGITTVVIGTHTYALVAAYDDDAVNIIEITTPGSPTPVAAVTDGFTFTNLGGATDITTVVIGTHTYALVASFDDDSVQIIDITDPLLPLATNAVTDEVGGFTELDGATDITTVVIGTHTYALVASLFDDGVQIIDITTPGSPAATANVTNDIGGFTNLTGASGITTVVIGANTYALVASSVDDGVQIIDITTPGSPVAVAAVTDGLTFTNLAGAQGITTVVIGANTYALVASFHDDGVQTIKITTPGSPVAVAAVTDDNGFTKLAGAQGITTVVIGTHTYALVASLHDDGVQIIDITNPSSSAATNTATDESFDDSDITSFTELAGASGITTVVIGANTYALVASYYDDGVQIIDISDPTHITAVAAVTDEVGGFTELDGAYGITTVVIGTHTYALVASIEDDGVQIIDITTPGSPVAIYAASDGDFDFPDNDTFDALDGASGITTVVIGANTYALVASTVDDGVQIIDITIPSELAATANITDGIGGFTELDGASGITTVVIGANTYALVASVFDNGVQIIDITTPGSPVAVAAVTDESGGFTELAGAYGITTAFDVANTYALVASSVDDGVQIIDITDPSLPLATIAVTDGTIFTELKGATDITTVVIGANTYALVASSFDDGVQIIRITVNTPGGGSGGGSVDIGGDGSNPPVVPDQFDDTYTDRLQQEPPEVKPIINNFDNVIAPKTIPEPKISTQLFELLSVINSQEYALSHGIDYKNGQIRIEVSTSTDILSKLETFGNVEVSANLIQLTADIKTIKNMLKIPEVTKIQIPIRAVQNGIISEGVEFIHADQIQKKGILGNGIKIAVLDLGFDTANAEIGQVAESKSFRYDFDKKPVPLKGVGTDYVHGTAVTEIITDIAPKSQLYLYTFSTEAEFLQAMDYAISKKVNMISMSAGWMNYPTDGTSPMTKKVEEAISKGIPFVVSSGNYAETHWEGKFVDANSNGWHEFSGDDEGISFHISQSRVSNKVPITAYVMWSGSNLVDLNLALTDKDGKVVASSSNAQKQKGDEFEYIYYVPTSSGIYNLGITSTAKSPDVTVEVFSQNDNVEYPIAEGSVSVPTEAKNIISVGAINFANAKLESFSSQGPTNNNKPTPTVVGPDAVKTLAYGSVPFYGTSAAQPHVAGTVALMLEKIPSITSSQIISSLQDNADKTILPPSGNLNIFGHGKADARFIDTISITAKNEINYDTLDTKNDNTTTQRSNSVQQQSITLDPAEKKYITEKPLTQATKHLKKHEVPSFNDNIRVHNSSLHHSMSKF